MISKSLRFFLHSIIDNRIIYLVTIPIIAASIILQVFLIDIKDSISLTTSEYSEGSDSLIRENIPDSLVIPDEILAEEKSIRTNTLIFISLVVILLGIINVYMLLFLLNKDCDNFYICHISGMNSYHLLSLQVWQLIIHYVLIFIVTTLIMALWQFINILPMLVLLLIELAITVILQNIQLRSKTNDTNKLGKHIKTI